jgi:predicted dinucleotide-utilizing enzyme
LDTVVVPAQEEGFTDTFIAENRWHHIRMSAAMIPQIKWIATYRVAPISAITHVAKVAKIEPYKDTGKYELIFEGPAEELKKPIKLIPKSNVKALQAPRYTSPQRLLTAKDLNEAF